MINIAMFNIIVILMA